MQNYSRLDSELKFYLDNQWVKRKAYGIIISSISIPIISQKNKEKTSHRLYQNLLSINLITRHVCTIQPNLNSVNSNFSFSFIDQPRKLPASIIPKSMGNPSMKVLFSVKSEKLIEEGENDKEYK